MSLVLKIVIIYLIYINLLSVVICCYDKIKARKNCRRISERTLLLLSAFGGALFMLITMQIIRHKINKPKFMLGIPLFLAIQIFAIYLYLKY